jgi:glutamate/tyrosine decarboxylase-like PLP-dependent enzyme
MALYKGSGGGIPVELLRIWPPELARLPALKVWLGLRQTGRVGAARQIADDIALTETLARRIAEIPELALFTRQPCAVALGQASWRLGGR